MEFDSRISHYPAIQQIAFYVNEASQECIIGREIYVKNYLLPHWRRGVETMLSFNNPTDETPLMIAAYQHAIDVVSEKLLGEGGEA
ncbi:hypothetical protein DZA65_03203 [Dickeya dianthicola]|uniref:hypothetical protein n=1 Tax=Dickeya dianthicola TaxID=204039 RepID=UPI000CD3D5E7|nr:hypothetical protein [Dickeya dianthicola]AYC20078.1 hypothetical protein DZA65_03203 [Dickeya dianthicola]MBI0437127.1 hypothetical protein [Dickeya dianthicola]MBI0448661.1 hypothetical protein [Dickeya dianthicola]MBI0452088.1 hypothetical protein [Dickeya dianthicola]MBI0456334.1 hypothetical protein [Dickeya dianthicola]